MKKEMLLTLIDNVVKVDRGGPESRIGSCLQLMRIALRCLPRTKELFIIKHTISRV